MILAFGCIIFCQVPILQLGGFWVKSGKFKKTGGCFKAPVVVANYRQLFAKNAGNCHFLQVDIFLRRQKSPHILFF
jgi:hypothetical protein